MRISDWSSDVCSSDLVAQEVAQRHLRIACIVLVGRHHAAAQVHRRHPGADEGVLVAAHEHVFLGKRRSEEHTSELQSLMRISYAVFCLKKKKKINQLR